MLNRPSPDQRQEDAEFEPNEVYVLDIAVSTGEGERYGWDAIERIRECDRDEARTGLDKALLA